MVNLVRNRSLAFDTDWVVRVYPIIVWVLQYNCVMDEQHKGFSGFERLINAIIKKKYWKSHLIYSYAVISSRTILYI